MKTFRELTIMIGMADGIRGDLPPEMREEMSGISEELVYMRNRYSQMTGVQTALPTAEEMEVQS